MSQSLAALFIVRLHFENGMNFEYEYDNLEMCDRAYKIAAKAKFAGDHGEIYDQAGRQAAFNGAKLMVVQLVDVQAEQIGLIKIGMLVHEVRQRMDPTAAVRPVMVDGSFRNPDDEPRTAPPSRSVFAS